jgi:hypothetical protein
MTRVAPPQRPPYVPAAVLVTLRPPREDCCRGFAPATPEGEEFDLRWRANWTHAAIAEYKRERRAVFVAELEASKLAVLGAEIETSKRRSK